MIERLGRAMPLGLIILGLGMVALLAAVVLEHYNMHRAQWYLGEAGMIGLTLGAVIAFVAALCQLLPSGGGDAGDG